MQIINTEESNDAFYASLVQTTQLQYSSKSKFSIILFSRSV